MTVSMDQRVMALPRVKLVCGRDWRRPNGHYEIGFLWDGNPWPRLGELIYRRRFLICIFFDTGRYI